MSNRKSLSIYLLTQVALLGAFYFRFICGAKSFYFEDITQFFEPLCRYIGSEIARAHIPLWNPYQYCGMPQIAITSPNIFYPPSLLFAVMPFNSGLAINMIIHQLLCGIGGFLLILEFGWGALPAAVCGVILSLSGYMFSASSNYTLAATAAWCPLTAWSFSRIASDSENRWKWTFASSVFISMLLYAGRPEIALPQLALLFIILLYLRFAKNTSSTVSDDTWVWQLRALLIGGTLAMPSLLPALEWMGLSRRSTGLLETEVFLFSSNWYDMLCLLISQPLGDLQLRYATLRSVVMRADFIPYISSAFVGPVGCALAVFGLLDNRWNFRVMTIAFLVIFTVASLGNNTPIMPALLQLIPALSVIRFPVKLLFFIVWCLAVLAARGIYAFQNNTGQILKGIGLWITISTIGAIMFALAASNLGVGGSVANLHDQSILQAQLKIGSALLFSGVVAIATSLLCVWKNRTATATLILISLTTGLLNHAWIYTSHPAQGKFFTENSGIAELVTRIDRPEHELQFHRVTGLYLEQFPVPDSFLSLDRNASSIATYQYARQVLKPNSNIDFGIRSANGFECAAVGDYYYLFLNAYAKSSQALRSNSDSSPRSDVCLARFCQLTATRYVLAQTTKTSASEPAATKKLLDERLFRPVAEDQNLNIRVYRVIDDLPRAYFSSNWRWAPSHRDLEHQIFMAEESGFDPSRCTWLEAQSNREAPLPIASRGGQVRPENADVSFLEDLPERITIRVNSNEPGMLILADQYYPGWRASIDDSDCKIYKANAFTRAVLVPKGQHTVVFRYQPISLFAGLFLAVLACGWLFFLKDHARKRTKADIENESLTVEVNHGDEVETAN